MRLSQFITENREQILGEWEAFARTLNAGGQPMTALALRDHASQILIAIAQDIEEGQSDLQQAYKSKGFVRIAEATRTAAMTHGALRYLSGFDLRQLAAEFRALRASVLRLWLRSDVADEGAFYQMTRFNESIDQALAESIANYSDEVARSRDTFLAILGHDLRSPLGALSGALHVLSHASGDAQRAETLASGKRSVAIMGAMIQDLLEYTRTRLGKGIPITPAAGDLTSVCKHAFDEVSLMHPQTAFRFEAEAGLLGVFDAARMQQVVSNLLNNAVQHGQRGSPVTLIARANDQGLVMQVKNRGRPIAPEMLQVIFDPLVQVPAEESQAQRFTNLGLGLFIAREIVLAHGGTIEAASGGEETQFTVQLPRHVQGKPDDVKPGRDVPLVAANA